MDRDRMSHKFQTPALPPTILHRKELVHALVNALTSHDSDQPSPYKFVLLYAPAGYGKTTLLVDAASQLSSVCCWYLLDTSDANPLLFLQRLLTSIRRYFPAFGRQVTLLFEESESDLAANEHAATTDPVNFLDALIDALKNEISQPFVLFLCNFHEINQNQTINQLLDHLIAYLPQQGVVVIESQAMPNLTLASLIAHHQMFGIGTDGLRFTSQEVQDLARLRGMPTFSQQAAEQLTDAFEGWIAGILLGSHLGYFQFHRPLPSRAEERGESVLSGDHLQLLTYITSEVFKYEGPTYEFLKKTSILARLTPEHCNVLLEINDAAAQLTYAEQRGLFVVRDRENRNANQANDYVCHPVLRQLFTEHLRQQSPEDYCVLHRRAAHLLQAARQYEQALAHACQAQEYTLAVSIILETAPSMVYEEQGEMMLHWLKMLPEEIFQHHPQLLLIASNIHLRQGEFALVPPLLDTVEALLATMPLEQDQLAPLTLPAELCIARGHLLFFQGEFQRTRELCLQALELLPPDEHKLQIRAYQYLGVSLIVGSGQVEEGITQLQRALQMSRSQQNETQIATLHRLVANAYSWLGKHALAEYHQTRAFQIWDKLSNSQGVIYSLSSMGLLKLRQGFTQQAEEFLSRALHQARDIAHFKSGEAYVLVALGDLHNSLDHYTEALSYLEDGLNLARQCKDRYLTCCSLCNLAVAYLFMGDTQTAQFFLNQISLKEGEKNSFEGCLFHLTQGTVYLAQQNYDLAEPILEDTVDTARRTNIQIILINALLRLVLCYLRQGKKRSATQTGKGVIDLNKKGDFDSFLQIELRRYPELQPFLDQLSGVKSASSVEELPPHEHHSSPKASLQVVHSRSEALSFQIQALGEPKVLFQGIPVTRWRMARAMELFFLLLEHGRPMRKEQLTAALWPEHDSDQIDSTVRTTIYYLRKALGGDSVIFQAGLYSLNLSLKEKDNVWYDVAVFNENYSQAKKALEEKGDEVAAAAFTRMVDLYHGDYVQPFYNDWCIFRRDTLRQAYMDAHHQLALIAWRGADWEKSLQHWQHLLTMDSCYEKAHYGIMRCYIQQGKRGLALRQFQRCSQNLQEELQAKPGALLQKLHQNLIG